jgi:electron transport complex protein RnfG
MLINFIKQSWLVIVAALAFGLLVSSVHGLLEPEIKRQKRLKIERKLKDLFGQTKSFEEVKDPTDAKGEKVLYYVVKDGQETAGYALEATGSGFADKITLLVAFETNLQKLMGIAVLKSNETPGFGDQIKHEDKKGKMSFKNQFKGCPADKKLATIKTGKRIEADENIVAITGSTVSSEAVTKIVNEAVIKMKELLKERMKPEG